MPSFQSLLFWMMLIRLRGGRQAAGICIWFQSLFFWMMLIRRAFRNRDRCRSVHVSILVLLDDADPPRGRTG